TRFYERHNANVHRGVHTLSEEATSLMEEAREKIAAFIRAPKPHTVIFTRNATEAINLVAHAWGRKNLKAGDEVLLTELEHHSNLVPWQMVAQATGAKLKFAPLEKDGTVRTEKVQKLLSSKTKLFAFTAMSNALGTINPVAEWVRLAHEAGALALVDGAQWVPHLDTDVAALDCDFLAFSAHKMLGPTGIGILYGKEALLEAMDPFLGGGDMIREVKLEGSTWNILPYKFEAGTPNVADAAAFGAAIDYLGKVGFKAIRKQEEVLLKRALELAEEEGVTVYGPKELERRGGVVSFNVADLHPHDVGQVFDLEGVAIRAGHHCCQPLMRSLKIGGTARASFYFYNTLEDVAAFGRALRRVKTFFKVGAKSAVGA
ncbi:MAG TPA: SufS family cysteine desulfurase, partial [Elusimicrobiota bacterium]|nr:SufS family cysteine desulfurase [Elusimicrobiota bacterium]